LTRPPYLNRDFKYVWVNLPYARGIGYDAQGLIGKNHFDLFPNQDHLVLLQKLVETGQKGMLRDTPFKLPFQPERVVSYWDVVAVPVKDAEGKVLGLVLTVLETTERKNNEMQLERIAREWREAFDNIPDFVSIHDVNYRVVRANRALSNALGMRPQDIIGKPCYELLHKSHKPLTSCPHQSAMESKAVSQAEFYEPALDLYLEAIAAPIFDENGRLVGSVHIARNITKRRVAEKALIESERKYHDLIENMQEGIWLIDKDANTTFVNPRMADMLGYSPAEMQGRNLLDFVAERGVEIAKYYLERRQQGIKERHEFEFIKKDGKPIYTMLDTSPLKDDQGNYIGASAVIEDITERKRAEEALQVERDRLRSVLEVMPMMVCLLSPDYRVVFANRAFREKFGESHGRRCYEYCFGEKEPCDFCETYKVLKTGKPHRWQVTTRDGSTDIDVYDFPFADVDGSDLILEVDIDITERKRYETELNRLYREEKKLCDRLENELKKRMEFTHALVHELKTPLTPIVSSTDMLVRTLKEDRSLRLAKNVYRGAIDLEQRVDALLELARLEAGMRTLKLAPVNILRLIRDTVSYMLPQALNKEQLIRVHLPKSLPKITADMERVRQVLMNLISNALRHTAPRSEILVTAWRENDDIMIEVQDNGQGIAEEMQKHLFDPYYQIQNNVDHLGGLGLGLPIAKNIVEQHGGHMWVRSEIGRGSTFGFSLPSNRQDSNASSQSG